MSRAKVNMVVPSWGVSPSEAADFRTEVAFTCGAWQAQEDCPYEFYFSSVPDMAVQFAREKACASALNAGMDYVAMLDDDMRGPASLWRSLLALDVDIVAPLMFMRQAPHYPVIYAVRGGWHASGRFFEHTTHIVRNYPKQALVECDAVGFGAVLIKTSVLKAMPQPWFFTWDSTKGRTQTGEDVSFCIEARKKGFRVFCDTRVELLHLGPRTWIGEEAYERENPDLVRLREVTGDWSQEKANQGLVS